MTRRTRGRGPSNVSSGRESVESFVLVFLAFLVLGVEAEGFVIPTGSMAPTLLGRHKDVTCPQCGLVYQVDGNREAEPRGGLVARVEGGVCVNCRFPAPIGDEPNFQGDRVYVMKTPLSIPFLPGLGAAALGRWDVAVFKLPEEPEVRYIKRLIGMPDEVVRIHRGDIWVRRRRVDAPFRRALRPSRHQEAMQVLVHDDAHRPVALAGDPRWARWAARTPGAWGDSAATPGVYRPAPGTAGWSELRYRHVVPDPAQWAAVAQGLPLPHAPRATLVTDFYSYNTDLAAESGRRPWDSAKAWRQPHWVGDLNVELQLDVERPGGAVRIELVKAGLPGRCVFDLETGLVGLWLGDLPVGQPVPSGVRAPGRYAIRFANVDDRLAVSVDGRRPFGDGMSYDRGGAEAPTAADLEPVGVAARGAAVRVGGLVVRRDLYYTLKPARTDYDSLELTDPFPSDDPVAMFDWLADPRRFAAAGDVPPWDYPIAPGRYMMLGDNSPWSSDGRAWKRADQTDPDRPDRGWDSSGRESWEVPESLLIGKAFCVYWPHLKPFGPAFRLGHDMRLPARPGFENIRWVR